MDNVATEELAAQSLTSSGTVIDTAFTKTSVDKVVRFEFSGYQYGLDNLRTSSILTIVFTVGTETRTYRGSYADFAVDKAFTSQVSKTDWFDISGLANGSTTISIVCTFAGDTNTTESFAGAILRNKNWN